jgi:uroporphyrinogen-III synthase
MLPPNSASAAVQISSRRGDDVRVLLTRPEADGERTAAKLRARGCEVLLGALIRIDPLTVDFDVEGWGALVITSANAAAAIEPHPRKTELLRLPVFTVGRRTASSIRQLGFTSVQCAQGNQKELVRLIAAEYQSAAPLLYLAGEDRSGDLAGDLARAKIPVRTVVVYRAAQAATLPGNIRAELAAGRITGVFHFSRRSAEAYLACADAAGILDRALAPIHFCLSGQVAEPLIGAGALQVRIAFKPEEEALINLIHS